MYSNDLYIERKSVDEIQDKDTHIILEDYNSNNFNKLINSKITHLEFGYEFNKNVDKLPNTLTHLTFGDNFNQNVDQLPKTLTHLTFNILNINLDLLSESIEILVIKKFNTNVEINDLPSSIKEIYIYKKDLNKINSIYHSKVKFIY